MIRRLPGASLLALAASTAFAQPAVESGIGTVPGRPGERIVEFTFSGRGWVAGLSGLSPGWSVTTTNDTSCTFVVRGEVVVGAAALEIPRDLPRLRRVLRVMPCGGTVSVRAGVTLARPTPDGTDEERRTIGVPARVPR